MNAEEGVVYAGFAPVEIGSNGGGQDHSEKGFGLIEAASRSVWARFIWVGFFGFEKDRVDLEEEEPGDYT